MPQTPLDRALHSKNAFLAFAGIITAVAAWTILKPDPIFPLAGPSGDPTDWTKGELTNWLRARGIEPEEGATRELMAAEVKIIRRQQAAAAAAER
ncbi:uncharacterized protein LAJ45_07040 [Morchella importuna]|uniref:uncharacterized protein n=1 Tax=Morchella importuna TaxID=1174673 RepID=UPI001E8E923D|nr:uncharacterized protein LAJ45_07040 [Morchella importuna]KAH8149064.1 hypothetical protein LAJ45_07040 [Morchella importuna]